MFPGTVEPFWVPCRTLCRKGSTCNSKGFYLEPNRFYLVPKMFFQGFSYRDSQRTLLSSRKHFFFKDSTLEQSPMCAHLGCREWLQKRLANRWHQHRTHTKNTIQTTSLFQTLYHHKCFVSLKSYIVCDKHIYSIWSVRLILRDAILL